MLIINQHTILYKFYGNSKYINPAILIKNSYLQVFKEAISNHLTNRFLFMLLKAVLPMKPFDKERTIRIIRYHQTRNYIACKSHEKKKKAKL